MFLAYGDDSTSDGLIAYMIVGIKSENAENFVVRFREIKKNYSIPLDCELHARILFHDIARGKSDCFKHLNFIDVIAIVRAIIDLCHDLGMPRPILGIANKKDYPELSRKATFDNGLLDPKQMMHLLKNGCLLQVHDFLNQDCTKYEFYSDKLSDQDKTSRHAHLIGGTRIKNKMPNVFLDNGTQDPPRLKEKKWDEAPHKEMYEVVDVFLSIVVKALNKQDFRNKRAFADLADSINPTQVIFQKEQTQSASL